MKEGKKVYDEWSYFRIGTSSHSMMADLNMLLELLLDGADLALVQPRWQLEFEALKYRRGLVQFEWCRMLLCRGNGIFCKCWSYAVT